MCAINALLSVLHLVCVCIDTLVKLCNTGLHTRPCARVCCTHWCVCSTVIRVLIHSHSLLVTDIDAVHNTSISSDAMPYEDLVRRHMVCLGTPVLDSVSF